MYQVHSPIGESFFTAELLAEDTVSFLPNQKSDALQHYQEYGFVVIRDLLPKDSCTALKQVFEQTIKPFKGTLQRHNGKKEENIFNNSGFLANPLMNLHQNPNKRIVEYTNKTLELLTDKNLKEFISQILKGTGIGLLTWNQFEGNPTTEPHHDCYFWGDDLNLGEVVGAWIALENIHPGAGRLYVYQGSHKKDLKEFATSSGNADLKLNPGETQYQELIVNFLKQNNMPCKAPFLRPGDVLFWDARTIHGSLETLAPEHSRTSFTAHYSLNQGRFVPENSKQTTLNGVSIVYSNFNLKNFMSSKIPILRKPYQLIKNLLKNN